MAVPATTALEYQKNDIDNSQAFAFNKNRCKNSPL